MLQNARRLVKDLFNVSAVPDDEDGLMQKFIELSKDELSEIKQLLVHYYKGQNYPGKKILEEGQALFRTITETKDNLQFYERLSEKKDEFLAYEKDVIDVKNFFRNQQVHFDRALEDLDIYKKNKTYVLIGRPPRW